MSARTEGGEAERQNWSYGVYSARTDESTGIAVTRGLWLKRGREQEVLLGFIICTRCKVKDLLETF